MKAIINIVDIYITMVVCLFLFLPNTSIGQERSSNDSWLMYKIFESNHCVFSTVSERNGFGNLKTDIIDVIVVGMAEFEDKKTIITARVYNPTTLYIKSFDLTIAYHENFTTDSAIESLYKASATGKQGAAGYYYDSLISWWVGSKKETKKYNTLLKPGDQAWVVFEIKNKYYPEKYPKYVGFEVSPVVGFDYMPIFK